MSYAAHSGRDARRDRTADPDIRSTAGPAAVRKPSGAGNQAHLRGLAAGGGRLQARLEIGPVDHPLEREADAVADHVMRRATGPVGVADASPQLSRRCAACEAEDVADQDATPLVAQATGGGGQPLDPDTRSFMESGFARDFGDVRVHTGAEAARSAEAIGARAFTVGRDLVFAHGAYRPGQDEGRRLLAHELAHTVQQGAAAPISVQRDTGAGGAPTAGPGAGGAPGGAPATSRSLTAAERATATSIFGTALNLDPIVLEESGWKTAGTQGAGEYYRTVPDRIYVPPGKLSSIPTNILMHELTHCTQYQHGVSRATTAYYALKGQYDYGGEAGLNDAIAKKKCFLNFNTEQQGDIVQHYYERSVAGSALHPWSVFINQLRTWSCVWPPAPAPAPAAP